MNPSIQPLLIVVTGRPASGKSTLSYKLARAIRCPVVSRDEIKEGLINTLKHSEASDIDIGRHVYNTFFETLEFLLRRQITIVAEAAFQHKLWSPKLEELQKIARIKIIVCSVDAQLAKSRFIERGLSDPDRANFHDDWAAQQSRDEVAFLDRPYELPKLNVPILTVDTSENYQPSLDDIVSFIRQQQETD